MNGDAGDRLDVCDAVYRYATGIDTRDWALYRAAFAEEIDIDFSSWNGVAPYRTAADRWVAGVEPLFTGLDASQHSMTNPVPTVDPGGATARCRMYVQADHVLRGDGGDAIFSIGGWYDDRLVRVDGGWRISAVTLTVWWRRGDASIMTVAAERGRARLGR